MITQNRIKTVLTLAAVAMAIFLTAGSASALDNSGFETPDQGDSGYTNPYPPTGVDGWTFTGGSGLSGPNGPWKCNSTSPDPLGDQFAYLQGAASISQDVTGLAVGVTYNLSFFEAYRTGQTPSNDLAVILDEGLPTENTIYYSGDVNNATWEERQTDVFLMAKASYTLTFRASNPLGSGDRSTLIDGVLVNVVDPMQPSPADGSTVPPANPLELRWTNLDPNNVLPTPVFVDVWFGTDSQALAQVPGVSGVADVNSVDVDASAVGVYYWRVDSYMEGSSTGDPDVVGTVWTFSTDFPPSSVDAGVDMITWSGQRVDLEGTFADDSDPLDWTIAWSADPNAGVSFTDPAVLSPTVTITKGPSLTTFVVNPGFEAVALNDGEYPWMMDNEGWGYFDNAGNLGTWNPEPGFYGGSAPEGENIGWTEPGAGVPGGFAQILTETLTADTTYTLTVRVGNTPGYNWGGYKVQLLAGGTEGSSGDQYANPIYGGTVLAEDDNSLTIAEGTFETSTVTHTTGGAGSDPNVGLPIQIRLLAIGLDDSYETDFDNVKLLIDGESGVYDPTPLTVTLTLGVNDVINPGAVTDTMTIDVYDDACLAAIAAGEDDPADFDKNCIVNLADLAVFLDEYLTCTMPNDALGICDDYRPL